MKKELKAMKKTISLLIASLTLLSLSGCGKDEENSVSEAVTETTAAESETAEETTAETSESSETTGQILLSAFHEEIENDPSITPEKLAEKLLSNSVIQFQGAQMPVEQGLLAGFGNTEITGFKEGVMFSPMIGSIPFVGYIFVLEEGSDPQAFVQTLLDNADPRWNICTEADEVIADNAGNRVFFVMCPGESE